MQSLAAYQLMPSTPHKQQLPPGQFLTALCPSG